MKFAHRPQRPNGDDQLIPLINVIFLMLIFFMLAGRIAPSDPLEIEPPHSTEAPEALAPQPEQRTLLIAADGALALDGTALDTAALQQRLAAWHQAVPNGELRIKADARLRSRQLQETLTLLRELGIEHITLLATHAS
ncbi:biopolymer transporter ExbD [Marichromatium purpuratum 984]|uniref:Biopolymer transporter ExbD n=1 Tax=Marichromatium purpuratum 984 TaxID=765910 RepID=W0E7A0_MARPU|nr:biopolymer transporter ExbD [Marichromatium purpuratum]AHF05094.1 biopolymer transporter ExbD [Marichromatium purpuratum 984]